MKVIGINGSARKDGNTSLLIKAVFAELEAEGIETDLVQLHGKALEPCKACFGCGVKRQCVVKQIISMNVSPKWWRRTA